MRFVSPSMTLGTMRATGIRAVDVDCSCGRFETMRVDSLPDGLEVADLCERIRCHACGAHPRQTRPHRGALVMPARVSIGRPPP
jgi:hypothetical protein